MQCSAGVNASGISVEASNFHTNFDARADTYADKLSEENKKQFLSSPIGYFEKCAKWSAAANLKLALYYSGANLKVFDKIGGDSNLAHDQEFGGFFPSEGLFEQSASHINFAQANSFCAGAIRLAEENPRPDWSLIRDFYILKASILLSGGSSASENSAAELQKAISKIYPAPPKADGLNHSNALMYALYAYLMRKVCFFEMNGAEYEAIITGKDILPCWANFYFGYMLPKDKSFALEILKRNSANLRALKALCKIYSGFFDASDKDSAKYEYYNALVKKMSE